MQGQVIQAGPQRFCGAGESSHDWKLACLRSMKSMKENKVASPFLYVLQVEPVAA